MLLLKMIGILLSINSFAGTLPKDLWPKEAKMNSQIGNFSVDISSDSFKKILNSKKGMIAKYYWSKEKDKFNCDNEVVCPVLLNKIKILSGTSFSEYLKNYKVVETVNGWQKYKNITGTEDYSDISIKYENLKLSVIQKKPTGTEYINYSFGEDEFGIVLRSVEHKSFVGLQKFITLTTIEYGENIKLRLPSKVKMITDQSLITTETKTTKRNVTENYRFSNYSINNKENLEAIK